MSGHFFQSGGAGSVAVWGVDMGNHPVDGDHWISSSTESRNGSLGGNQGDRGVGVGLNRHWRRQWEKRASRGSGSHSRGGRIRSCSILRRNQFWTSVRGPLDGQERGCLGGGGIRLPLTWRVQIKGRQRQRRFWIWSRTHIRTQTRTRAERMSRGDQTGVEGSQVK